jgi:Dual specificity phosphatase, catalytic domain
MGHFLSSFRSCHFSKEEKEVACGGTSTPVSVSVIRYEYQPADEPWIRAIRVLDGRQQDLPHSEKIEGRIQTTQAGEGGAVVVDLPVHIHANVYLGNASSASHLGTLQRLNVRRVLNMAGPYALKRSTIRMYEVLGIEYRGIAARDQPDYPLLERDWSDAHAFLHPRRDDDAQQDAAGTGSSGSNNDHYDTDAATLVHCMAGLNRSALVVAADYMVTCRVPVLEVVRHIRRQRGNAALSNAYFQEQLVALARHSNLLGDVPLTIS